MVVDGQRSVRQVLRWWFDINGLGLLAPSFGIRIHCCTVWSGFFCLAREL
uniref:Uncharacterized protein n=1 Tax=Rhizophora mucronata TaxID=61149 RepID=A0A2P2NAE8_RHIMU